MSETYAENSIPPIRTIPLSSRVFVKSGIAFKQLHNIHKAQS